MRKLFILCLLLTPTLCIAQTKSLKLADPQACAANTVCLAWDSACPGCTFDVYKTKTAGGCAVVTAATCTKVNSTDIAGLTFNDASTFGITRYTVRAKIDGLQSGPSNELQVSLPPPTPGNLRTTP